MFSTWMFNTSKLLWCKTWCNSSCCFLGYSERSGIIKNGLRLIIDCFLPYLCHVWSYRCLGEKMSTSAPSLQTVPVILSNMLILALSTLSSFYWLYFSYSFLCVCKIYQNQKSVIFRLKRVYSSVDNGTFWLHKAVLVAKHLPVLTFSDRNTLSADGFKKCPFSEWT